MRFGNVYQQELHDPLVLLLQALQQWLREPEWRSCMRGTQKNHRPLCVNEVKQVALRAIELDHAAVGWDITVLKVPLKASVVSHIVRNILNLLVLWEQRHCAAYQLHPHLRIHLKLIADVRLQLSSEGT